jgi:two-component system response regulator (stage 0 sporulation protein F)
MKTLMIVEDENDIRESLCLFISHRAQIKVFSAANGRQAIDIYKIEKPECVFLDMGLPDMSGLDVLKNIKEINSQARVVIVSGNEEPENKAKAKALGAEGYISKPVDIMALVAFIANK